MISIVRMKIDTSHPIYLRQGQGESCICGGEIHELMHTGVHEVPHTAPAIAEGCVGQFWGCGAAPKTSGVLCTLVGPNSVFSLMLNGLLRVIPLMSGRLFCNKMPSDKNMVIRIWPCLY